MNPKQGERVTLADGRKWIITKIAPSMSKMLWWHAINLSGDVKMQSNMKLRASGGGWVEDR